MSYYPGSPVITNQGMDVICAIFRGKDQAYDNTRNPIVRRENKKRLENETSLRIRIRRTERPAVDFPWEKRRWAFAGDISA